PRRCRPWIRASARRAARTRRARRRRAARRERSSSCDLPAEQLGGQLLRERVCLRQQREPRGIGLGAHLRGRLVERLLGLGARGVGDLLLVGGGLGADLAAFIVGARARAGELLLVIGELGVG